MTFLSAVLIVLSFPPYGISSLIWVALVPWFASLEKSKSFAQTFRKGVELSFWMTLLGFHWVAYVLREFGGVPWPIAGLMLVLFALIAQPQFLLFAPIYRRLSDLRPQLSGIWPRAGLALSAALLYAAIDWILPKLWVDTLGHAFYASKNLRQVADLGGAPMLTVLVFLVNEAIWNLYRRRDRVAQPAAALVLCASAFGYGVYRNSQLKPLIENPVRSVQFGVIQANIGDFEKLASESGIRGAAHGVLRNYFSLSDEALALTPKPEILVWPETAYPSTFRSPQNTDELARDQLVEQYVRGRGVPLFFGGYDYFEKKDHNAFFFLSPKRNPQIPGEGDLQIYRKNILLLFGEYIPGAETFPMIKRLFPQVGHFGRGKGPTVVTYTTPQGPIRFSPIICYEALFPSFLIPSAREGSQFILNITNDGWFGPYGEPQLHLALSAFRSIETRTPQLRSTNTGISALILPDGEIVRQTSIGSREVMNVAVPLIEPPRTLIVTWGDWFAPFALVVGLSGIGGAWYSVRRRARFTLQTDSESPAP